MTPDEAALERTRLAAIAECDRNRAEARQWVRECNPDATAAGIWIGRVMNKLRADGDPFWRVYWLAQTHLVDLLLQVEQERIDSVRKDNDETP